MYNSYMNKINKLYSLIVALCCSNSIVSTGGPDRQTHGNPPVEFDDVPDTGGASSSTYNPDLIEPVQVTVVNQAGEQCYWYKDSYYGRGDTVSDIHCRFGTQPGVRMQLVLGDRVLKNLEKIGDLVDKQNPNTLTLNCVKMTAQDVYVSEVFKILVDLKAYVESKGLTEDLVKHQMSYPNTLESCTPIILEWIEQFIQSCANEVWVTAKRDSNTLRMRGEITLENHLEIELIGNARGNWKRIELKQSVGDPNPRQLINFLALQSTLDPEKCTLVCPALAISDIISFTVTFPIPDISLIAHYSDR